MKHQQFFVFDIETVALKWDSFDEAQQEYLLRGAATDEDKAKKIRELSLSPLSSRAVCICVMVMEWNGTNDAPTLLKQGALVIDDSLPAGTKRREELPEGFTMLATDEKGVLAGFWKLLAEYYDTAHLVSFNGKDFDAPFLMLRSAVAQVRPSRNITDASTDKPWDKPKKHIDLQKELTLYAFGNNASGATRKYNFDFYARTFGIPSPKSEGVHGGNVAELYAEGRIKDIAAYCMRDVQATWELFRVWHQYLFFGE